MSQDRRFSFEFFPAKTEAGHEKLLATARQLATLSVRLHAALVQSALRVRRG